MDGLTFQFVEVQRYGEVVSLSINDPPANTLTYDLVVQLEDIFFELSMESDVRAVVISGAGERFFSGGVNIGMLRNVSPHYNSNFLLYASEVFERIDQSPLLVVAAINGHATGGGLELALVADVRLAIEGTYNLGFPEVRLGVIPGLGGTQRLSRIVGPRQALELITQGDFISVAHANEMGIVDSVLPKEDFLIEAIDYTRKLLRDASVPAGRPDALHKWQRPGSMIAHYARRGRVGVITLAEECLSTPSLQVLWALNRAILSARLDDGAEALLLTHSGDSLRLGIGTTADTQVLEYAQFVFGRLENLPRLCVLAFRGGLDPLATELALACDYRLMPQDDAMGDVLLEVLAVSPRRTRYMMHDSLPAGDVTSITSAQAVERGLVRTVEKNHWPESALKWLERFVSPHGASKAIGYAKLAIVKGSSLPHEAGSLLERHLQEQLFRGHDGPEGMRAYLEKRAAVFKGE